MMLLAAPPASHSFAQLAQSLASAQRPGPKRLNPTLCIVSRPVRTVYRTEGEGSRQGRGSFEERPVSPSSRREGSSRQGPQEGTRGGQGRDSWVRDGRREDRPWRGDSGASSRRRFEGKGPGSRTGQKSEQDKQRRANASNQPARKTPPEGLSADRAYAAVCLLRVELGGAYSDLIFGSSLASYQHSQQIRANATSAEGAATSEPPPQHVTDDLGAYVERTLGFWPGPLDSRSRKKVTALVAGATRWRRYLDFLLTHFWTGPLDSFERMEPLLKQILRLGMLEIVKLETPPHAAVHEAVTLAKGVLRPGAGALVNGVLRAAIKSQERGELPSPLRGVDPSSERSLARALATLHSHPVWMVRRWLGRYGREATEALMQWNNQYPTFFLRPNTLKGHTADSLAATLLELGVVCDRGEYNPEFVHIQKGMQDVLQSSLIEEGACNVQDESAGLVVRVLDPQAGEVVVDCCAAPGGKTLYACALMSGQGRVVSVDVNQGRSALVQQAVHRQGLEHMVLCVAADSRRGEEVPVKPGTVDRVLVDAPCSGLGVLAKRADLRWRGSPEAEDELVALQNELLDSGAKLVKPGGFLVYSTCSIEPRENEERVGNFLERHHEFERVSVAGLVPAVLVTPEGYLRILPHVHGIDGAFAAKLRRVE